MSAATVPEFTSRRGRTVGEQDKMPFKLDGDDFVLIRPKLNTGLTMLRLLETDTQRSYVELGADVARMLLGTLSYIEEQEPFIDADGVRHSRGQELLYDRLNDPNDGFDLPDLLPVFKQLAQAMFPGRPTGGLPDSGDGQTEPAPLGEPAAVTPSAPDETSGDIETDQSLSTS